MKNTNKSYVPGLTTGAIAGGGVDKQASGDQVTYLIRSDSAHLVDSPPARSSVGVRCNASHAAGMRGTVSDGLDPWKENWLWECVMLLAGKEPECVRWGLAPSLALPPGISLTSRVTSATEKNPKTPEISGTPSWREGMSTKVSLKCISLLLNNIPSWSCLHLLRWQNVRQNILGDVQKIFPWLL